MNESRTPRVDAYLDEVDDETAQAFAEIDRLDLEQQLTEVAPWVAAKLKAPINSVASRLRSWEMLCSRIDGNNNLYMIDEYINDLDIRDSLEAIRAVLSGMALVRFDSLLKTIDDRFSALTIDDDGEALRWRINDTPKDDARRWWWRRRPVVLPWPQ